MSNPAIPQRIEHPLEITWIRLGASKVCIGCNRGISIVDVETLTTQDVIDPIYAPASPLFYAGDSDRPRPLAMFRIDGDEFLLCYDCMFPRAVQNRMLTPWQHLHSTLMLREVRQRNTRS